MRKNGFTLIELVAVIVILGVLSATALPKFIDLSSDARRASVQTGGGAILSAVGMVSAKARVLGIPADSTVRTIDAGGGSMVEVVGVNPSCAASNGIWSRLNISIGAQYYVTAGGSGSLYCTLYAAKNGVKYSDNCGVVYDVQAGSLWTPVLSGC